MYKNKYTIELNPRLSSDTADKIIKDYEHMGWNFVVSSTVSGSDGSILVSSFTLNWPKETEPVFIPEYPLTKGARTDW